MGLLLCITTMTARKRAVTRDAYICRLTLSDKAGTSYSTERPREFLSRKAVDRRQRQGLATDSTDLPVSEAYLSILRADTLSIRGVSKWNNTVLVSTADTNSTKATVSKYNFVTACEVVYDDGLRTEELEKPETYGYHTTFNKWDTIRSTPYGSAASQIDMLGGKTLHDAGYNALDITIAVLDGGFFNADNIPSISDIRIAGVRNFVFSNSKDVYTATDHGTRVLSVMGTFARNVYIGTAPAAKYYLLRCEDSASEQPIEEDWWAMAVEYADSIGADIINSSVGYSQYDRHRGDHRLRNLDGRSTLISRTAAMAADKGMIVVCSAGNNGMTPWKKLNFPADADNVLTVGAVTAEGMAAPFSSVGPSQDGRVKPDVMALGSPTTVISGRGTVIQDMGTSFATPIITGLVACLWQALPDKTAKEIIDLVRQSGSNCDAPDNVFGYGIPDFGKAWKMAY